jgi:hypothetical protein
MRNNFNSKRLSKTEVAEVVTNHVSNEETEVGVAAECVVEGVAGAEVEPQPV